MANTPQIPVLPYQLPDRAIVSLLNLAPRERVRASSFQLTERPADIPIVQTTNSTMSVSAALDLGFAGIVAINASLDSTFILRETQVIYATVDRDDASDDRDGIVETEYYGLAIRTGITAWNVKASVKVNFEELVAQCTLNTAQSAMQIQGVGLGINALPQMLPNVASVSAGVNAGTFQSLSLIEDSFWRYVVANHRTLTPVLLGVDLRRKFLSDVWQRAPSVNYALFGIMQRESLSSVLPGGKYYRKTSQTVNSDHVRSVYAAIVGASDTQQPTASDKRAATKASFNGEPK
jgi:hypothetical protein